MIPYSCVLCPMRYSDRCGEGSAFERGCVEVPSISKQLDLDKESDVTRSLKPVRSLFLLYAAMCVYMLTMLLFWLVSSHFRSI